MPATRLKRFQKLFKSGEEHKVQAVWLTVRITGAGFERLAGCAGIAARGEI
jgi:hypothetical protein